MGLFAKNDKMNDFEHSKKLIEEIIKDWKLDPDTLYNPQTRQWSLIQGSANFYISLFNLNGMDYLEVAAALCKIPAENILPFYRKLLELNDFYIGVKLSVKENQVWLLGQRQIEDMSKKEARRLIDDVRLLSDELDDKLMQEFGTTK